MRHLPSTLLLPLGIALMLGSCGNDRRVAGDGGGGGGRLCTDTCTFAFDGECDDGGSGSVTSLCDFGTDCGDCGARTSGGGGTDTGTPPPVDSGGGDTGGGGCADGCPAGFSCVLGECMMTGGGGTDNGAEGESCMCDGTLDPDVYRLCSGTSDGCQGVGLSGELKCLAGETGAGTCRYSCSSADLGVQGDCPSGYTCGNGGERDIGGDFWAYCL